MCVSMDANLINNPEAYRRYIHGKFDNYMKILAEDRQACDAAIANVRQVACIYDDDEKLMTLIGLNRVELARQLDYFESESDKTCDENKTCILKSFQTMLNLHRNGAYREAIDEEREIAMTFQYRPSLLPNIKKIQLTKRTVVQSNTVSEKSKLKFVPTPTPKIPLATMTSSTSFSNRADIQAFQQKKNPLQPAMIESNEIDLTKFIREAASKNGSNNFTFAKQQPSWQQQLMSMQQQQPTISSSMVSPRQAISCKDALLAGANKRFVLLYNMNIANRLYIVDTQTEETKDFHWEEGLILSLGHVDGSFFFLFTAIKLFVFDIVRERIDKQYFLYDTLYKDLLPINSNLSQHQHPSNQLQSTVYDDYCYYLYTNTEHHQLLIKCALDGFLLETNLNLSITYSNIKSFLDLAVDKSSITFLVIQSDCFQVIFCDEIHNWQITNTIKLIAYQDPTKIVTTFVSSIKLVPTSSSSGRSGKAKQGKQIWFVLDGKANCVHCLTNVRYLTRLELSSSMSSVAETICIYDQKLIVAKDEMHIQVIDLDAYFAEFAPQ